MLGALWHVQIEVIVRQRAGVSRKRTRTNVVVVNVLTVALWVLKVLLLLIKGVCAEVESGHSMGLHDFDGTTYVLSTPRPRILESRHGA